LAKLPSKLESFIEMMRRGDDFARHGFDLMTKRPEPEQYFDALNEAGFFDPSKTSGPVPASEPGFVQIPFWPALNYLGTVSKRAGERDDVVLSNKLRKVIRDVSNVRDSEGNAIDNYHTYYKFAEMLGELPLATVTKEDIDLTGVWLDSRFDRALVATALSKGLLKKLLASSSPDSIEKACLLMKRLMAFRWLSEEDKRGREIVTYVDDYWLKEILKKYAKEFGVRAGYAAVKIFEEGLRAIFSDSRRGYGSTLWRPAIEDNTQNTEFRPENRFVEGMREALAGWIETKPAEAVGYVTAALKDKAEIIQRMAIHTVTEYFELLREPFEAVIDVSLFTSANRHELYRLLRERFAALSPEGRVKVIEALKSLPKPKSGEDPDRRLKYTQREWLSAIKDQPEAAAWFQNLSADAALGSVTDHPDFLSYHETRLGPGPTPLGEASLVAFAEDGTIVDRLNEFKEKDTWRGPTLGGLVAALEAAVAASPNTFFPSLFDFHRAKIPFQHAFLTGLKRVFDQPDAQKPKFDWNAAWPKLMTFFSETLGSDTFWSAKPEENVNLIPTRTWMTSLIAGFLEAGTKDDKTAYDPALLPKGWELIQILLERAADGKESAKDPMTYALNTEKGRVIGAMYNHALRVCRLAKQNEQPFEQAWATLKPVFDAEIAKCRNANFEFSTLSSSYIANLEFMSHAWLVTNVKRLFPVEYPANLKAALGGLAYATPSRPIYQLLASNGVLDAAFRTKLEDGHGREKIIQWICLAYLWGDESLTSPLMAQIFDGSVDDLQEASDFFWQVHGEKLTPDQVERVLAFWEKALEWAKRQEKAPASLFARLARLAPFLATLNKRAKALLLAVVPYVHTDYATDHMVKELDRLSDSGSATAAEILEHMFEASTPNFDMDDNIKKLLRKLYDKGHHAEVLRCIERLRKTLPGMLELYKTLGVPVPKAEA
jgi:hypothetical protein